MSRLREDIRLALRRLSQQPGFTAVVIATLALGLGANIAVFSLIHAHSVADLSIISGCDPCWRSS